MISNQITKFQIKSLFFKSNQYVRFSHDLNQIMIWICQSLVSVLCSLYNYTMFKFPVY